MVQAAQMQTALDNIQATCESLGYIKKD
jgi:enamine deaminase RidA (YjgF/YER057c/UK114 family)